MENEFIMNPDNFKLEVAKKSEVRDYEFHDGFKPFTRRYNSSQKTFIEYKNDVLEGIYNKYKIIILSKIYFTDNLILKKYDNIDSYLEFAWKQNYDINTIYKDIKTHY